MVAYMLKRSVLPCDLTLFEDVIAYGYVGMGDELSPHLETEHPILFSRSSVTRLRLFLWQVIFRQDEYYY